MTRKYTKTGKPNRASIAAVLANLTVGEQFIFPVNISTQQTMNSLQSAMVTSEWLEGMRFSTERYFLVREGELTRPVVVVTRTA